MVNTLAPSNIEDLRRTLAEHASVQVVGAGSTSKRSPDVEARISTTSLAGIIDLRPPDLTCAVRAGTSIVEFQSALAEHGFCIPTTDSVGTVGGAYMAHQGSGAWRDWTIGATFMLADGTVAKSGSHAVKSVAGYDVHRFMAGTRGSLAICLELILRLYPLAMKPEVREPDGGMVEVADPTQIRLMKRAKEIFDPANKLNPGVWGFM
jgi:glycolate oxidase FAD binding subunit